YSGRLLGRSQSTRRNKTAHNGLRYCGQGLHPSSPPAPKALAHGPWQYCLLPGSLEQKIPAIAAGKPHKYRYAFGWLLRAAVMAADDPLAAGAGTFVALDRLALRGQTKRRRSFG